MKPSVKIKLIDNGLLALPLHHFYFLYTSLGSYYKNVKFYEFIGKMKDESIILSFSLSLILFAFTSNLNTKLIYRLEFFVFVFFCLFLELALIFQWFILHNVK